MNVENEREAVIERGKENKNVVNEEVRKALKKMKNGKAPGVDRIACEMLKEGRSNSNRIVHTSGKCMHE